MAAGLTRAASAWRAVKTFFLLGDEPGRNPAMEGLRGYAVLLVFLVHSCGMYLTEWCGVSTESLVDRPLVGLGPEASRVERVLRFLGNSFHGVDLFFLLSGFLIARIMVRSQERFSYRRFLWQRFLRIYPPFLLAISAAAFISIGLMNFPFDAVNLAKNFLLLCGCPSVSVQSYDPVAWSLFYEAVFYLTFPPLFFLAVRMQGRAAHWRPLVGALILGVVLLLNAYLGTRVAGFLFGAAFGTCRPETLTRLAKALPTWFVALVYGGVLLYFKLCTPITDRTYFWVLFDVAACLLFVKACFGDGLLNRVFRSPPLRLLGNVSYSFYLMHHPAMILANAWFGRRLIVLPGLQQTFSYFAVHSAVSLLLSVALFAVAERWYFWYARAGRGQRPAAMPAAADAKPIPLARAG